ncbi:MAG: hypothetical protein ACPIA5_05720, partial [Flavobacteriales bacterium]
MDVCGVLAPEEPHVYFNLEASNESKVIVKMPPSAAAALQPTGVPYLVDLAIDRLLMPETFVKVQVGQPAVSILRNADGSPMSPDVAKTDALKAFRVLNTPGVGFGFLKSCFQKIPRVHADMVTLPDGVTTVNARLVVMVALGLCFSKKGDGFIPDLGMFVRGQTAALKRLGVICCEDALPYSGLLKCLKFGKRNVGKVVAALMGAGLTTMRVSDYNAPDDLIVSSLMISAAAVESRLIVAWRDPPPMPPRDPVLTPCDAPSVAMAARLLRVLRSFEGDMNMYDRFARLCGPNGVACFDAGDAPRATVPLLHAIDQHVFRGVGHVDESLTDPFYQRFRRLFDTTTGFNPRLTSGVNLNEASQDVVRSRKIQKAIGIKVFGRTTERQFVTPFQPKSFPLKLDPGVLSGGTRELGPFKLTTTPVENVRDGAPNKALQWSLLVIVGVETPEPIVIHAPVAHSNDNNKKPEIT